ncbi:DUF4097 family beta strand repeat-containing protein [Nonomuraea purpurea]|uniref:DUF4097 family beta strand repeat-containing protein n=1 Tax=Nonomuraea purpurea TaxID=1849276 RepID=A0ABV8FVB7_9ACTN
MKTMVIAGGLLASALLLSGCGLANVAVSSSQDTVSYEVTEKVTKLQLKSNSGEALITETDGGAIRVTETLRWRGDDKPRPEHKVEGQALFVTYDCPSNWGSCGVDYKIEVPKGLAVDLDSGSGNLTLRGLTGPVNLHAGSGDVDATGLAGKKMFADVGSGQTELKYSSPPDSAEVKTGSGDVTLNVPDGAYDVKTDVGSGDAKISVKNDASSQHKISLTSGSGNVSVLPG